MFDWSESDKILTYSSYVLVSMYGVTQAMENLCSDSLFDPENPHNYSILTSIIRLNYEYMH